MMGRRFARESRKELARPEEHPAIPEPGTITRAVNALAAGEVPTSVDPAVTIIYEQLKVLAAARLRREPGALLQPTDLVHEAVLKLFRPGQKPWENRAHFFGSAARAVEQLLIDQAKKRRKLPTLLPDLQSIEDRARDPIAIGAAVEELEQHDPVLGRVARLRIFGGQTRQQVSELLGIPARTLDRHWAFARTWLYRRLFEEDGPRRGGG